MAVATAPPAEAGGGGGYVFVSTPAAIDANRPKYRPQTNYAIQGDPRIIRGSTYMLGATAASLAATAQQDPTASLVQSRRRRVQPKPSQNAIDYVPAIVEEPARAIDLSPYLVEQADEVAVSTADTQTDRFLDRAPSPPYVPRKTGLDAATQVYPGDLFDFDFEVKPIIDVVVNKTLEQALLEVREENEMEAMRLRQEDVHRRRDAEADRVAALEAAEAALFEEKEARLETERQRVEREKTAIDKLASVAYAKALLLDLPGSVFGELERDGYLFSESERDIETGFMPWLMDRVAADVVKRQVARDVGDLIIRRALGQRVSKFKSHRRHVARDAQRNAEEADAAYEALQLELRRAAAEAERQAKLAAEAAEDSESVYSESDYSSAASAEPVKKPSRRRR